MTGNELLLVKDLLRSLATIIFTIFYVVFSILWVVAFLIGALVVIAELFERIFKVKRWPELSALLESKIKNVNRARSIIKITLIVIAFSPLGLLLAEYFQHPEGFGTPLRTFMLLGFGPLLAAIGIISSLFNKKRPAILRIEIIAGLIIMFAAATIALMSVGIYFIIAGVILKKTIAMLPSVILDFEL